MIKVISWSKLIRQVERLAMSVIASLICVWCWPAKVYPAE